MAGPIPRFEDFHISETVGVLLEDPLTELPEYFSSWTATCRQLKELVTTRRLRHVVYNMELLDHTRLQGYRQFRLAFMNLSFIGSAYIWQNGPQDAPKRLPKQLAIPWHGVSSRLGLPPVICQACMLLSNYQKIDQSRPLELENIALICRLPPDQSDWFFRVTWQVELDALPALKAIISAMEGIESNDWKRTSHSLDVITNTINTMKSSLARMHERLSADVFYNDIRPFLSGYGGQNSPLPLGIIFDGVSETPIQVIGGSAAQSTPVQCLDAALGIKHDKERSFLEKMKDYMPPAHAAFIRAIEAGPSILNYVNSNPSNVDLVKSYQSCVDALREFRTYHLQIVTKYIIIPARKAAGGRGDGASERGTGGTGERGRGYDSETRPRSPAIDRFDSVPEGDSRFNSE